MRDAAVAAGAPENVIGCLSMPSMGATDELMKCKGDFHDHRYRRPRHGEGCIQRW